MSLLDTSVNPETTNKTGGSGEASGGGFSASSKVASSEANTYNTGNTISYGTGGDAASMAFWLSQMSPKGGSFNTNLSLPEGVPTWAWVAGGGTALLILILLLRR